MRACQRGALGRKAGARGRCGAGAGRGGMLAGTGHRLHRVGVGALAKHAKQPDPAARPSAPAGQAGAHVCHLRRGGLLLPLPARL